MKVISLYPKKKRLLWSFEWHVKFLQNITVFSLFFFSLFSNSKAWKRAEWQRPYSRTFFAYYRGNRIDLSDLIVYIFSLLQCSVTATLLFKVRMVKSYETLQTLCKHLQWKHRYQYTVFFLSTKKGLHRKPLTAVDSLSFFSNPSNLDLSSVYHSLVLLVIPWFSLAFHFIDMEFIGVFWCSFVFFSLVFLGFLCSFEFFSIPLSVP